jgi:hypothetical protein
MASGKATIPAHLRGNPGDCFAILLQAARWRMDPYAVSQKTHLVNGVLGYEAQLVIAVLNANAPITGRIKFEWFGPWDKVTNGKTDKSSAGVRAFATLRGDSEPTEIKITMAQAGVRNSPLWTDDPRQQLAYLAAKRWARLYCPDVIMGVYTLDELDTPPERDITPVSAPAAVMAKLGIEGPTLAEITARINQAETDTEMRAIARDAKALPPEDLAQARELWAMKKEVLAARSAEVVDAETGEIQPADGAA